MCHCRKALVEARLGGLRRGRALSSRPPAIIAQLLLLFELLQRCPETLVGVDHPATLLHLGVGLIPGHRQGFVSPAERHQIGYHH